MLGTSAGPIVDAKVFPAKKLLADDEVIGSGPYMISSYSKNQLAQFQANPNYTGPNAAQTSTVTMKYYTESDNLKLDLQNGDIDVAYRTLSPTDIDDLKSDSNVKVLTGSGGELRYLVFNLKTMPGDNDEQKLAIRQAMAYSVDRQELATDVYKGTYQPAYSMVPQGIGVRDRAVQGRVRRGSRTRHKARERARGRRRRDPRRSAHRLRVGRPLRPDLG